MAKALGIHVAGFILLFFLFLPSPCKQKNESSFIYSNPLISKAALGSLSPLAADFAWLESTKIGEMGKGGTLAVNTSEFKNAFLTIASLDPSFYHAINYGVSFLSTIPKDKASAYDILDRALSLHPNDFRFEYLKLIIEVTSEQPNKEILKTLAMSVFTHPEFNGVFGTMKVDDFLLDILAFAGDAHAKKEQLKKELTWLHKNTSDKSKKALIETKLKELN